MMRERSRSLDDRSICGNPNPNLPHDHPRRHSEPYVPALRHSRRVLLLIDLDQTKRLLTESDNDPMDMTSCDNVADLRASEELALFTYSRLLSPSQLRITSQGPTQQTQLQVTEIDQMAPNAFVVRKSSSMELGVMCEIIGEAALMVGERQPTYQTTGEGTLTLMRFHIPFISLEIGLNLPFLKIHHQMMIPTGRNAMPQKTRRTITCPQRPTHESMTPQCRSRFTNWLLSSTMY